MVGCRVEPGEVKSIGSMKQNAKETWNYLGAI